jgi:hypothetical protein
MGILNNASSLIIFAFWDRRRPDIHLVKARHSEAIQNAQLSIMPNYIFAYSSY